MKTLTYKAAALAVCIAALGANTGQAQSTYQASGSPVGEAAWAALSGTGHVKDLLCDNRGAQARQMISAPECQILMDETPVSANGTRIVDIYALKKNRAAWNALSSEAKATLAQYEIIIIGTPAAIAGQLALSR